MKIKNVKPVSFDIAFDIRNTPHTKCYICKNIKRKKSGKYVCIYDGEEFIDFLKPEKCEGFEKQGKYNPSRRSSFEHEEL